LTISKYFPAKLEETLQHLLQYINKYNGDNLQKLAISIALFVTHGLVSAFVIHTILKDHLIKEGKKC
jgi:hypothetical protein